MANEQLRIEIDGEPIADLITDLVQLEVELDEEMAGMFRLQLALPQEQDGTWRNLDDARLAVWKPVTIKADFESGEQELLSGFITHLCVDFPAEATQCVLEISGIDGSVAMDREDKLLAWSSMKDSEIAEQILSSHGFTPEVDDSQVIHDAAISTIIQRETDMQFLRRLAVRNGFECYVEGTRAFFRAPQLQVEPQPVLAAHFGEETNLTRFNATVNALAPANVAMSQLDRLSKDLLDASISAGTERVLGEADAAALLGVGIPPGAVRVGMTVTTGQAEMNALCQGLFHRGQWFVSVQGTVDAARYGTVLRPRQLVPIKGVGETYSGLYYITHVTHRFSDGQYCQEFRARRNALRPVGDEPFTADSALPGGL